MRAKEVRKGASGKEKDMGARKRRGRKEENVREREESRVKKGGRKENLTWRGRKKWKS